MGTVARTLSPSPLCGRTQSKAKTLLLRATTSPYYCVSVLLPLYCCPYHYRPIMYCGGCRPTLTLQTGGREGNGTTFRRCRCLWATLLRPVRACSGRQTTCHIDTPCYIRLCCSAPPLPRQGQIGARSTGRLAHSRAAVLHNRPPAHSSLVFSCLDPGCCSCPLYIYAASCKEAKFFSYKGLIGCSPRLNYRFPGL